MDILAGIYGVREGTLGDSEKVHSEKGHSEKGHSEKGHSEKGHSQKGHSEKGHFEQTRGDLLTSPLNNLYLHDLCQVTGSGTKHEGHTMILQGD